ncbi:MAG: pyruvate dehydrogenase E2 component (dihydrolipoamide acetyltransferase) [Alphaproteobacteria bacterium]|jgi:pyruvate dehydrogenase E2 component (dihydrolipoamide acetyltransferase)
MACQRRRIAKITVQDGTDNVKVGTQIAFILAEGETADAIDALTATPTAMPVAHNDSQSVPQDKPSQGNTSAPHASPSNNDNRVKASPLARRIASEHKIDLNAVNGSGPKGRIVKADIEQALNNPQPVKATQTQPSNTRSVASGMSDDAVLALYNKDDYEAVPIDSMRKIIASRLLESKTTIPHFYLNADINLDKLLDLRKTLNDRAPKEGNGVYKLSVNDFIIKAMALALQQIPDANVTWTENSGILKHRHCDVGVAVSVEGGLFTPIIRKAEQKSLTLISNEMKDLAKRARSKKLSPQEYQGGTTAISNLGMYGVKNFNAIINPPHASILAVGAGVQRPIVKENALAIGTVMCATLSIDHRAVDGTLGADLLKAFKTLIEDPMSLLI